MRGDEDYKSKITREEYLQIFALFMMANGHSQKAYEFEAAMNRIVRPGSTESGGGHLGDAIYSAEPATVAIFEEALRRQEIEVEDAPQK